MVRCYAAIAHFGTDSLITLRRTRCDSQKGLDLKLILPTRRMPTCWEHLLEQPAANMRLIRWNILS